MAQIEFKTGVIRPVECLREGWQLIKDQYWLFFGISFVGIIIASLVPFGIFLGPMMCGIFYVLMERSSGRAMRFEDLFKGINYFMPSLVATLFLIVPSFLVGIVMYVPMIMMQISIQRGDRIDPDMILPYFLGMIAMAAIFGIIAACIHALLMFAYPLIVEHNLSGKEAFFTSARAVLKNLGGVVGLIACQIGLGIVGYLVLCVGVYFTLPVMFAAMFVAYRKVFPSSAAGQRFDRPPSPDAFRGAGDYT